MYKVYDCFFKQINGDFVNDIFEPGNFVNRVFSNGEFNFIQCKMFDCETDW